MTCSEITQLARTWCDIDERISVVITSNLNTVTLYRFYLPPAMRRQGYGTQFMEELTTIADRNNLQITLTPTPMFGTPMEGLLSFYETHGFRLQGTQMVREPYQPS